MRSIIRNREKNPMINQNLIINNIRSMKMDKDMASTLPLIHNSGKIACLPYVKIFLGSLYNHWSILLRDDSGISIY
jgi:hypothetical protein